MLQADVCNFTHMCEYCSLRDINGACSALQPQEWLLSLITKGKQASLMISLVSEQVFITANIDGCSCATPHSHQSELMRISIEGIIP